MTNNKETVIWSDVEEHSTHWPDGAEISDEERARLHDRFQSANLTDIVTKIEPLEGRGWVVAWEDDSVFDVRVWADQADAMQDHGENVNCAAEMARQ